MLDHLDARAARQWGREVLAQLGEQRAEIDALNVFPVPDGDTGTNLYLTIESAAAAVEALDGGCDLPEVADAFATGALLGARGNSGVILSQLLRGWAHVLAEQPDGGPDAVRDALQRAADEASRAVSRPVEGTMRTVARAAAQGARDAAGADLAAVVRGAVEAADDALARTTDQLEALHRAGVVDAGAQGLVVLLESLLGVVTERRTVRSHRPPPAHRTVVPDGSTAGPEYEVMYLLDAPGDGDPGVTALRDTLDRIGESTVVVGGGGLWNVHVHTDDIGAAIEAGVTAGRPHRIRVTRIADQWGRRATTGDAAGDGGEAAVAVVATAAGSGLAAVLEEAGAVVVPSAPGRRPSTTELLDAVRATHAQAVILLPNDGDTLAAAGAAAAAARDEGVHVAVLPTRAAVQGLAALAVHDPRSPLSQNLVRMSAAAAATRHGAVTVAAGEALTSAGWCRPGDALGLIDGDVAVIGTQLPDVAADVVTRMLTGGGELLTVVTGDSEDAAELAEAVVGRVRAHRLDVEVNVVAGGQPGYPLLLGVE
ncbi:MAG TPA: DAK2 domain-containing protein [Angustibacter sp.]|nr:DAK2 domain-containing protein [Angustibacter sp.]